MSKQRRYSKQRERLLKVLSDSRDHPTAETIYAKLRERDPRISLGTVYRNLNLLSEEKKINKMRFPVERYDYHTFPHPHLLCSACGGVSDLAWNSGASPERLISSGGSEIIRYDILCAGICKDCLKKE